MSTVPYFEKLLAEHGDSPRALDWSGRGQSERFAVLADFVRPHCKGPRFSAVLDVGCGLGHFRRLVDAAMYIGLDASPMMITAAGIMARDEAGGYDWQFAQRDVLDEEPLPTADCVVASGVLNVIDLSNGDTPYAPMTKLLAKCFAAAKIGCAVNMLSTRAPERRDDRRYYDPCVMLDVALHLTPKVALKHDYLPNDFTLFLYK